MSSDTCAFLMLTLNSLSLSFVLGMCRVLELESPVFYCIDLEGKTINVVLFSDVTLNEKIQFNYSLFIVQVLRRTSIES